MCGDVHGRAGTPDPAIDPACHPQLDRQSRATALLCLRRPSPAGAAFADWNPALPAIGTDTVGIHHPLAGPQRLTTARVGAYSTCVEVAWCGDDADPEALGYLRVETRTGRTLPGSSGSGLFNAAGQLIGTDLGGSEVGGFEYYERVAGRRGPGLAGWLGVGRCAGHLSGQARGIHRPRQLRCGVLSIKTTKPKAGRSARYEDAISDDGYFSYAFQGDDPRNRDNTALREAFVNHRPASSWTATRAHYAAPSASAPPAS